MSNYSKREMEEIKLLKEEGLTDEEILVDISEKRLQKKFREDLGI